MYGETKNHRGDHEHFGLEATVDGYGVGHPRALFVRCHREDFCRIFPRRTLWDSTQGVYAIIIDSYHEEEVDAFVTKQRPDLGDALPILKVISLLSVMTLPSFWIPSKMPITRQAR